jgi:hypothetical protein
VVAQLQVKAVVEVAEECFGHGSQVGDRGWRQLFENGEVVVWFRRRCRQRCELFGLGPVLLGNVGQPSAEVAAAFAIEFLVPGRFVLFDLVEDVPPTLAQVSEFGPQSGGDGATGGVCWRCGGPAESEFAAGAEDVLREEVVGEVE